jgi:hypothetical protein
MEDRVKILQENLELREKLARQEIDLANMKIQLTLGDAMKHRIEVCETQLAKAHEDLNQCQEQLAKAGESELGKKVNELEVYFPSPLLCLLFRPSPFIYIYIYILDIPPFISLFSG